MSLIYRAAAVLAACVAAVLAYNNWAARQQTIGEQRATARYERQLADLRAQAAHALAVATSKVLARERELAIVYNQQEAADAAAQTHINRLRQQALQRAAQQSAQPPPQQPAARAGSAVEYQPHGRLRVHIQQPAAAVPGCAGPASAAPAGAHAGAADAATAGGLLPAGPDQVAALQRIDLATEAEQINAAYASCRAVLMAGEGGP